MCPGAVAATSLQYFDQTRDQRCEGPQLDLRMHCLRYRSLFLSPRTLVETSKCADRNRTSRRRLFMSKPTIDVYGLGVFSNPEVYSPSERNPGVFVQAEVFSPSARRGGLPKRSMCFSQWSDVFPKHKCFSQAVCRFFFGAPGCFVLARICSFHASLFVAASRCHRPRWDRPRWDHPRWDLQNFAFFLFPTLISFFFHTLLVSLVDLEWCERFQIL